MSMTDLTSSPSKCGLQKYIFGTDHLAQTDRETQGGGGAQQQSMHESL